MNFDEVFSTEPQKLAEVPYADLKKKFYTLIFLLMNAIINVKHAFIMVMI